MAYLSLSLLGPFQAWTSNGSLQTFRTLKERALLTYLAVENGRVHQRETLASLFWSERREGVARNNLRQALYGIRQVIGEAGFEAVFSVTTVDIQLNLSDQIWLDLTAFEGYVKAAQQHNHSAGLLCPYCQQNLRDAVEIYRGDFIEDVFLEDNQKFQDWVTLRRDRLFRHYCQSLEYLVTSYETAGDFYQAVMYASRQVQIEGLKENLFRRLMLLQAKAGRKSDALETYEIFRRNLIDKFGKEPEETTAALAEQLRQGWLLPNSPPVKGPKHKLPEYLPPFIGREMELDQIYRAVKNPACRLISVVGPAGVGKTRLAVGAGCQNLPLFSDGVCFISLESVPSAGLLEETMIQALGLGPSVEQEPRQFLLDYLKGRQILLLLDNFEHLQEGKAFLLEILHSAPLTKILVTSRERLRLQAEYLIDLGGLSFPALESEELELKDPEVFQRARNCDAVRLLFERASRAFPAGFSNGMPVPGRNGSPGSHSTSEIFRRCKQR